MKEWKEISRKNLVKKYGRSVESVEYEMPDGVVRDFFLRVEHNSVCILALTQGGEVILARQFRPGPQKILSELPGGCIDSDETPIVAIARELREETGYAGNIEFVTRAYVDGYSSTHTYCFVATDCEKVAEQMLDTGEFVDVELMPLFAFRAHLQSGNLTDVYVGYLGLDHLGLL